MKFMTLFVALLLTLGFTPYVAQANVRPVVESFTFTPNEVEIISTNTTVTFELVVSHPSGIKNSSTQVNLSGPSGSSLVATISRTDTPINPKLTKVTFKGSLVIPQNIAPGAYIVTVNEVNNNPSAGYEFGTGTITNNKLRDIIGAESNLLVRKSGDLDLDYETFVGPTHNTTLSISYSNPELYNNNTPPIWKVGEIYNPNKYYELRVPSLPLMITSSTPTVCSADGKELKLIATGNCTFKVFTTRTKDYILKESIQNVTITAARIKPELVVGTITSQTSTNLPKSIEIFRVYSPTGVYVLPKTTTPTVCIPSGFYVQIVGGGTCTLTYQSDSNTSYLASDLYKVSFEITRDSQALVFSPTNNVNLSSRSIALSASASSGAGVLFSTSTPDICSIFGSTLNLLKPGICSVTATQGGTATLAPVSATATIIITPVPKTLKNFITCAKGANTKRVSGVKPKCPKGFKIKN
jgi:hypothetical protein